MEMDRVSSDRPGQIKERPRAKNNSTLFPRTRRGQQLTKVENDVNAFDWAPDSERIAFP